MDFSAPALLLNRRNCIVTPLVLAWTGISASASGAVRSSVLVLGDSLSAEYGLRRGSGWVALAQQKLRQARKQTQVVNASISGDTSSGGRSRLPALLQQHQPRVVVIELGANDALRGLPLDMTRDNLTVMSRLAKASGARVLLLGIQVPPNYGRDYNQRFAQMFVQVATATQAELVPFFLTGIADVPDSQRWFQADRIHPNEAAQPQILANVWPALKDLLQ